MAHRDRHPVPRPGCFGCHVDGVGYQGIQSRAGGRRSDPTKPVPVVADDGPRRGQVVGKHVEHWDGRQDAVAVAPVIKARLGSTEISS